MPALRESTTAVIMRGEPVGNGCCSEPYEAGWAIEAILFMRLLESPDAPFAGEWHVEISGDGIHWVAESEARSIPANTESTDFYRLAHFGNWIRVRLDLPADATVELLCTLNLKG